MLNKQLMDAVLGRANLRAAYRAVKSNGGAAGVDGMSIDQLAGHVREHWPGIEAKLRADRYEPAPLRVVKIPKGGGGQRELGIPGVLDRLIQQSINQVLTAIFDPHFSEHSYGFRPGKSAHGAVKAAQQYVRKGKSWVVDIDISAFFDNVNHDILMHKLSRRVNDKTLLHLIGKYLRAGKKEAHTGRVVKRTKGTPQGGPLSPLLTNIYLDGLDQQLQKRGLSFCRYADDCNIYVGSERSARRVLDRVSRWIEKELKLKVNANKSGLGRPWERKFLGFQITAKGEIGIAPRSIERLKARVRELFNARQSVTSNELRDQWQRYIRGWWNYYQLAENRYNVYDLEGWIRRHMRKCFWQRWHKPEGRLRAIQKLKASPRLSFVAYSNRGAWRVALSLGPILKNEILYRYGFVVPSVLAT